jgi:proteasome lid subunit RPN8/RPN11
MRVRQAVLDAIAGHARRDAPLECCGLLVGTGSEILEAVPARNVADEPHRRYEVSPEDHFAQIRRCRVLPPREGSPLSVVGVYHSHPHSAALPSPTDREQAFGEFLYVIAGPATDALEIRAYRLEHDQFVAVPLDVGSDPITRSASTP